MTIPIGTLLRHYKRHDIQEAMLAAATDKEIAVKYGDKGFGKRPDVLQNPRDIIEFVKNGATSFHCSEELWTNPLLLETGKRKEETDAIRKGWDLVLDIDCKELRYSQIAADLLVSAISHHGIETITVKFSGNHGFHIGVPFTSFPAEVHGINTATLFPEGPRRIAGYLKEMIRPHLAERLAASEPDVNTIAHKAGVEHSKLIVNGEFDPFGALAIDTILLSSRHLYRMPYSFNEKSGLVSIPIDPSKILTFDRNQGAFERVGISPLPFLTPNPARAGEARKLIIQAFDFKMPDDKMEKLGMNRGIAGVGRISAAGQRDFEEPQFALQEELFPPCIKHILAGMGDGKKRAAFVLVNFLRSVGWSPEKIEERLRAWNSANKPEMLREQDLLAPIRYHSQQKKALPPNCSNKQYYSDIGACKPDNLCARIKNPAQYSLVKARAIARHTKPVRAKKPTSHAEQKPGAHDAKTNDIPEPPSSAGTQPQHQAVKTEIIDNR